MSLDALTPEQKIKDEAVRQARGRFASKVIALEQGNHFLDQLTKEVLSVLDKGQR